HLRAIVHPGGDARPKLPGVLTILQEQLGSAPRRHECGVIDEESGAGPVVLGMAEQLDPADATLYNLDFLALVFQDVAEGRHAGEPALIDGDGRAAIEEQRAFEADNFLWGQFGIGLARYLFQCDGGGFEELADGFTLPTAIWLARGAARLDLGDG